MSDQEIEAVYEDLEVEKIDLVGRAANGSEFSVQKSMSDVSDPALVDLAKQEDEELTVREIAMVLSAVTEVSQKIEFLKELVSDDVSEDEIMEVLEEVQEAKSDEQQFDATVNDVMDRLKPLFDNPRHPDKDMEKSTKNQPKGGSDAMSDETEEQVEEEETEKNEDQTEEETDMEKDTEEDEEETSDMEKDIPEDVQKKLARLETLEKEQEETKEELQKERRKRIEKDYIEKARTEYDKVTKSADELGPKLMKLDESLEDEDAEFFKNLIKAQAEQVEKAGLFDEQGSSREGSEATSEFEKKVEKKLEESDVSKYEARVEVYKENPELTQKIRA